jgi:NAD(P)-dependent dehydrogenase (short-subunit alcohol dehydrogenase family)
MKKKYKFNFTNKNIVITGGIGNLGEYLSTAFLNLNANVIIVDKTINKKKNVNKKLKFFKVDLSNFSEIKLFYKQLRKKKISIDCLINNATYNHTGVSKKYIGKINDQDELVFKNVIDVNLVAPFILSKYLSKLMSKAEDPNIINVSSIYSNLAPDFRIYNNTTMGNSAAYSSSKSGLNQLTRWLASNLAPKIRVNSISPGGIQKFQKNIFVKKYKSKVLLNKMAKEDDIVGPILFLASNIASYITGENLTVDGGYSSV